MNRYRITTTGDILEFNAIDIINAVMIATKSKGYELKNILSIELI